MEERDKNPNKLCLRDAYDELWRCRDFELSHVWHRSVFLGAFLIGCYAVYGGLVCAAIQATNRGITFKLAVNTFALIISIAGIFLSVLWIMMAKGSKAWYEKYEQAIWAFWHENDFVEDKKIRDIGGFGEVPGCVDAEKSSWLFSAAGGKYSPSRINVILGQLSLIAWSLCVVLHVGCYKVIHCGLRCAFNEAYWTSDRFVCVVALMSFAVVACGIIFLLVGAKSSSLD